MSRVGLTAGQKDVYNFLRLYHNEFGIFPSLREIMDGKINEKQVLPKRSSTTPVFRMMHGLKERGWINIMPGKPRGIEILQD